jgi:tRNA pseudouridine55 synthase
VSADRARVAWRRVDGVLLLDKPPGSSSSAALQAARRLYRADKAGHGGTLDPLATGLLPCLFGEATKFGVELLDAQKAYAAVIALGATTTTGDAEGAVVERRPVAVAVAEVERVLGRFRGRISQVPPAYSALKRDGRPLYEYARSGEPVDRAPRSVTIHELVLRRFDGDRLEVSLRCSKGTYVRALAEDVGRALGCGAHLAGLRRTAVGRFAVADAIGLDALEALAPAARDARLLPVVAMVEHLPEAVVAAPAAARFRCGQAVRAPGLAPGRFRVHDADGAFIGIGEAGGGELRPRRLVRQGAGPSEAAGSAVRSL